MLDMLRWYELTLFFFVGWKGMVFWKEMVFCEVFQAEWF